MTAEVEKARQNAGSAWQTSQRWWRRDVLPFPPMPREDEWTAEAACKGQPDLFFPPFGERPHTREAREAQAKEICAACPVQEECLWHGRRHHEYGIWGGENELERVQAGYGLLAPIGTRHLPPIRRPERRSA